MEIPQIETDRLLLRAHRIEDYPAAAAMWADPSVTRYIGGKPSTPQQTWARILTYAGHWTLMGYGYWAVVERATDTFAGEVGFADFKRGIAPSMDGVPEIGWSIAPQFQGRGIATEAVLAAQRWGDRHLSSALKTACLINAENAASIRVAEKCGFVAFDRVTYNGTETILFQRLMPP